MAKSILLVEDDRAISQVIMAALEAEGCSVDHCTSIARRNALVASKRYAAILTDVMLEDGDGIATLGSVLERQPDTPVIVLSAQNTLDTAVRASEAGAYAYFPKPFDLDELIRAVLQAIARSGDVSGNADADPADSGLPLVGRSAPMQNVYRMITRVLRNDLSVLILGESGTGKELVAEAIHQLGHRKQGPFVAVNMAAIPAELIESELFGHEKGAFTGAVAQSIGKFEQAHGGTLFLDEIGDMPMQAQTRLLRTLQTGRITRVGGHREIELDVRFVAATNKPFGPLLEAGLFREDLDYRINVVPIDLPPLRDRLADLRLLVDTLVAKFNRAHGKHVQGVSDKGFQALHAHHWPGNVRELENVIERGVVLAPQQGWIEAHHLFLSLEAVLARESGISACGKLEEGCGDTVREQLVEQILRSGIPLEALEQQLMKTCVDQEGGNIARAARRLGMSRPKLSYRLQRTDGEAADS